MVDLAHIAQICVNFRGVRRMAGSRIILTSCSSRVLNCLQICSAAAFRFVKFAFRKRFFAFPLNFERSMAAFSRRLRHSLSSTYDVKIRLHLPSRHELLMT